MTENIFKEKRWRLFREYYNAKAHFPRVANKRKYDMMRLYMEFFGCDETNASHLSNKFIEDKIQQFYN